MVAQFPSDLDTIKPWHFKVQNNHIWLATADTFQRRLTIRGSSHDIELSPQEPGELPQKRGIVVGYHDAQSHLA